MLAFSNHLQSRSTGTGGTMTGVAKKLKESPRLLGEKISPQLSHVTGTDPWRESRGS